MRHEAARGDFSEYYVKTGFDLPVGHEEYALRLGDSAINSQVKLYIISLNQTEIANLHFTSGQFLEQLPDGELPVSNIVWHTRKVW